MSILSVKWVAFVLFLTVVAEARDQHRFFFWDDEKKTHYEVDAKDVWEEKVFAVSTKHEDGSSTQHWISRRNLDSILVGSTVLGDRLGKKGIWRSVWYRLGDSLTWSPVMPTSLPSVHKYNKKSGVYLSEHFDGDWIVGHHLPTKGAQEEKVPMVVVKGTLVPITPPVEPPVDPKPPTEPKPPVSTVVSCEVTASPGNVIVGETVVLSLKTSGPVVGANLDGAAVDFPVVLRTKVAEKIGENKVVAYVFSEDGTNQCETTFTVRAGN